jgi:hypothetical protein
LASTTRWQIGQEGRECGELVGDPGLELFGRGVDCAPGFLGALFGGGAPFRLGFWISRLWLGERPRRGTIARLCFA